MDHEGILLVDKPPKLSSFAVVAETRRRFGVKKVGHGGTLDPFATGLLVILIGRNYTRRAGEFLHGDKEYRTTLFFGAATDTYDNVGKVTATSDKVPTLEEIKGVVARFQGTILQIPPMFSAKKIAGKRLYELARKGVEVERAAVSVTVQIEIISYSYPLLELHVQCSKGTYIRSLGHDIGCELGCHAHLVQLRRVRSGEFLLANSVEFAALKDLQTPITLLQ